MSKSDDKPYEVGYGRPPKQTQFQKGVSGNPLGRPAKQASLQVKDTLLAALAEQVTLNGPNGPVRMSMMQLIMSNLVRDAAKSDPAARKQVMGLAQRYGLDRDPPPEDTYDGSVEGLDRAITFYEPLLEKLRKLRNIRAAQRRPQPD
jgi:hypothetical protein